MKTRGIRAKDGKAGPDVRSAPLNHLFINNK